MTTTTSYLLLSYYFYYYHQYYHYHYHYQYHYYYYYLLASNVCLTCIGPYVCPTRVRVHRNVETAGELLALPATNEGCLDSFLDIPADNI